MAVSESLRGVGRTGQATREKVLKAAHELGYRVNASAKAVRYGRFNSLALLVSLDYHRHRVLEQVWNGVHDGLQVHDLQLTVHRLSEADVTGATTDPAIFREAMADGFLVNYGVADRVELWLRTYRLPAVWLNYKQRFDSIYPQDFEAAADATRRLLELGHRRIIYVDFTGGPTKGGHYSTQDRYAGYKSEMRKAGLEPQLAGDAGYVEPQQRLDEATALLGTANRPTAVLGYSAASILPLFWAATARCQLRVPEDLSLVSFHHRPLQDVGVPVATVVIPEKEMGYQAVAMLVQKIRHSGRDQRSVALPATYFEGTTVGPAPWNTGGLS